MNSEIAAYQEEINKKSEIIFELVKMMGGKVTITLKNKKVPGRYLDFHSPTEDQVIIWATEDGIEETNRE